MLAGGLVREGGDGGADGWGGWILEMEESFLVIAGWKGSCELRSGTKLVDVCRYCLNVSE